ncbi:MAG: hypothetical protein ACE5O2_05395 [Armatimonadota bacterium]
MPEWCFGRTGIVATCLTVAAALTCGRLLAAEERIINSFEDEAELADWQLTCAGSRLVEEGVTHGAKALEMTFDPGGRWFPATMFWNRVIRDWSAYDALVVDVLNPNDFPIAGNVLVADQAWADRGRSYWNRHNGTTTFAPGRGKWVIPVHGLYRGEAGSRNNDIKTDIDPSSIVRLDLSFGSRGQNGRVIVDRIRFVKVERPEGIWAFDFGPPSQPVMLGWTGVSQQTAYSAQQGYGWGPQGGTPWDGAARDTTFGTMLTQDFCEAGGYNFRVDVPPGAYDVLVIFENCGYWGGEQALHTERKIVVNGRTVWSERRPDGPSTPLYRFEQLEPVGVDIWDAYMASEITKPVRFRAETRGGSLTFAFQADVVWGSKISALALHRADDAAARAWLDSQMEALASEFRAKAVCLDLPAERFVPPTSWGGRPLVAWPVTIEQDVTPTATPTNPPPRDALRLSCDAVKGEFEPVCLALRPSRDLGECRIVLEQPGDRRLPATVQAVWYNTSRGFGTISYRVKPHTLRAQDTVALPRDLTREIVVTFEIPEDAAAGDYAMRLRLLAPGGAELLAIPVTVTVHNVVLSRETDFLMGFFGLMPPARLLPGEASARALEETLALLRDHGMNALSGGPSWRLTGWKNGVPQIDFSEVDRFFALCRKYGFNRPINGYGGLRFLGLHDRYQKGPSAEKVVRDSGLDYETAFMRAWEAVDQHARENGWPLIYYAMCDETRVRDVAERELEFMRLMAKVSARFPRTVRTSGAYSVDFKTRPTNEDDLKLWHQRFFAALDVSSLNNHDDTVMAEAERLGKEIHIYNQGRTRYSFGLYQWSEYQKGVRARWQWHLNILHGYQFFDLDGREPDTAMICYGRKGIYPTIHFERCREGAEDFYLYQTLFNAIRANEEAGRKPLETKRAADLLNGMTARVGINQRTLPEGFDPRAFKRQVIRALQRIR